MDSNEFYAPVRSTPDPAETPPGSEGGATPEKPAPLRATVPVWIDLHEPGSDEIQSVQDRFGIVLPTREEMQEIELSSRLYEEDGALFMTVSVLNRASSSEPETTAVTFVLVRKTLITVRYADPVPFKIFLRKVERHAALASSSEGVLLGLLEQIVDRLADIMELSVADLEAISNRLFARDAEARDRGHHEILRQIGRAGNLGSKAKDSLLNLNRVALFLSTQVRFKKDAKARLKTLSRDILSITEHANFIANKVTFLLDATLGLINIEQSNIIKIFSVAAAAFLPPTLIASIYGMNFEIMPELQWDYGYPAAIVLMILSAVLPLWYFRRKGWL
ncbi:magnesium/cobalt transporter CorA [Thalassospira sp.]|uniref:magnesium/cobalt transporter CorA n=1 Tax=Thalassospira sp. TaxID=1912094 RepID=UPI0027343A83|nr:magnesium/cobalt transporter CorA [Thalassospira sp.]MDP2698638.1 magnesium/cobalt transporter CorA [Thalassospira sp.]